MSGTESSDRPTWLGGEFLTWLWYESERAGGHIELEDIGNIAISFAHSLVLEAPGLGAEGNTVRSETPSLAEEARTALKTGKKVAKTRILIDHGEQHYEVTFAADDFTFGAAKLPTVLTDGDEERLLERLGLLDRLEAMIDGLYVRFVRLRLDTDKWLEVRAAMHAWVIGPAPTPEG